MLRRASCWAAGVVAAGLLAIPAARGADFQGGEVGEMVAYSQTGSAAPGAPSGIVAGDPTPFFFSASVWGQPISVSSATVSGGAQSLNIVLDATTNFHFDSGQDSLSALEGFDGTYSLQVNTVHDGTKTFNGLSLSGDNFPSASHITNWIALQSANVNQPITIDWTLSNVAANGWVVLSVFALSGSGDAFQTPIPGEPGVLTGASTGITIPAATLLANETYTVELAALNPVAADNSTYPGALVASAYVSQTALNITTAAPGAAVLTVAPPGSTNVAAGAPGGGLFTSGSNGKYTAVSYHLSAAATTGYFQFGGVQQGDTGIILLKFTNTATGLDPASNASVLADIESFMTANDASGLTVTGVLPAVQNEFATSFDVQLSFTAGANDPYLNFDFSSFTDSSVPLGDLEVTDIGLTAVPEPASFSLVALASVGLIARRRQRASLQM